MKDSKHLHRMCICSFATITLFKTSVNLQGTAKNARAIIWIGRTTHLLKWVEPQGSLTPGHTKNWVTWKSDDRLRTRVVITKVNLRKGAFCINTVLYGPGQATSHSCHPTLCPSACTTEDFMLASLNAVNVAHYWQNYLIFLKKLWCFWHEQRKVAMFH